MQPHTRLYPVLFSIILMCGGALKSAAQMVDTGAKITLELPGGHPVELFPALDNPLGFYCLPNQLRLSVTEENQPEFLLMLWGSEGETAVNNGIMHWLLTWGLLMEQEKLVSQYLVEKVDSNAVFLGTLAVKAPDKYRFTGKNTALIQLLQSAITSGGGIPTVPGGKSATSFKFNKTAAQTIEKQAKDPKKWEGVIIEMPFFDLNNVLLCTLQLEASAILRAAVACDDCFLLPGN
jgi:hypothetical protein